MGWSNVSLAKACKFFITEAIVTVVYAVATESVIDAVATVATEAATS